MITRDYEKQGGITREAAAAQSVRGRTTIVEEGVRVTPMPATLGETVTIEYEGLLANSGASQIYAHIGYGFNQNWTGTQDIPMRLIQNVWACSINPVDSRLNFCFHDGAQNWDNNNGHNWSFTVHNGHSTVH